LEQHSLPSAYPYDLCGSNDHNLWLRLDGGTGEIVAKLINRSRATQLTLLCHASTSAVRTSAFPADEPIAPQKQQELAVVQRRLQHADRSSPEAYEPAAVADWMHDPAAAPIGAPPQSFWRIDIVPLSMTRLSGANGRWSLSSAGCIAFNVTEGENDLRDTSTQP
jgi:hypothetical protein